MTPPRASAPMPPAGTSGSLIADKRYAYAEALAADGDLAAAADLFAQAGEAAPGWAAAALARGLTLERLGDGAGARAALGVAAHLDEGGLLGAALHLGRLDGTAPSDMPAAYVATLFDQYAPRFDAHLLDGLAYRGPQIIAEALAKAGAGTAAAGLDLGCGTGLMGRVLAHPGLRLDGVDLSAAMLRLAEATGCYRGLWQGDCVAVARDLPAGSYGLAVAADVLVYLGDLRPLCDAVARLLAPGGWFAATVQARDQEGYDLGPDLRFRHAPGYLRTCLEGAGLTLLGLDPCVTRRENDADVAGLVFVARRP